MDELHQRGKALEDHFFKEKDKQLMEKFKADLAAKEIRDSLAQASGIDDEKALDSLVAIGVTPESLTSVSLIPLVAVAWADGKMENNERKAILAAAVDAGVASGSPAYALLEAWLKVKPGDELLSSWKEYIHALKSELEDAAFSQLKSSVIDRATKVAESAGGFLGINTINDSEAKMIDELANAF